MGLIESLFGGNPKTSLRPFEFKSSCHQRFQSGTPVMGIQYCERTLSLVINQDGCPGYRINKNDGYIIRAINGDTGQQQFAPKPMRLVATNNDSYLLRGYEVDAQTPFGWQTIDLSDYGFEVRYKDGEVHSCILYMYDRDVRIEYYR